MHSDSGRHAEGSAAHNDLLALVLPISAPATGGVLGAARVVSARTRGSSGGSGGSVTAIETFEGVYSSSQHTHGAVHVASKVLFCLHPKRCTSTEAVDIYEQLKDCRVPLVPGTKPIVRTSPIAALDALGGIEVLVPLFPLSLLVLGAARHHRSSVDSLGQHPTSVHSDVSIVGNSSSNPASDCSDGQPRDSQRTSNRERRTSLDCLISIIAHFCRSSSSNIFEFSCFRGIQMIKHLLQRIDAETLANESESTILSLLDLRVVFNGHPELEGLLMSKLLCNFDIWYKTPLSVQRTLMSFLHDEITSRPLYYLSKDLGCKWAFDTITKRLCTPAHDQYAANRSGMRATSIPNDDTRARQLPGIVFFERSFKTCLTVNIYDQVNIYD